MRICTIRLNDRPTPCFAFDDRVVPFADAWRAAALGEAPPTVLAFIEADTAAAAAAAHRAAANLSGIGLPDVSWLPPVKGFKIVSTAINNAGVAKLASVVPQNPPFFLKPPSAMVGHGEPIIIRPDYGLTHPEAELAVVIGRRVKNLTAENAMSAVFGYTIINDITSITLKSEDTYVFPKPEGGTPPGFEHGDMQLVYHARSKGTDTFAPIGPWIVTSDEVAQPNALGVRVFMADEEVTADDTSNLRHPVEEVLVWASRYFTLEPGDIVHLGTAAAGKYALRELDLQVWDGPLSVEIDGIGRLSNPIERVDLHGRPVPARKPDPANLWPPRYDAAPGATGGVR